MTEIFECIFLSLLCTIIAYGLGHHSGYKHASKLYREMYWKMSEEEVRKYRERIYGEVENDT